MFVRLGRFFWTALTLFMALLPGLARAQSATVLYFWNPVGNENTSIANTGQLTILGYTDTANWTLWDITTGTPAQVATGTIGAKTAGTPITTGAGAGQLKADHVYKLTADKRINAFFGGDCCSYYGSFQAPSDEDASRRVGKSFTFWAPVINASTETWVFSREAGTVTVTGPNLPTAGVTHAFTGAQQKWKLPTCASYSGTGRCQDSSGANYAGIAQQKFYSIASTGLISVEQSVNNGIATIPTANGWDVGPYGMFDIHANFKGAYAIYAYKDGTQFEVHDVTSGDTLIADGGLNAGDAFYMDGHNLPPGDLSGHQFLVKATSGRIALWGGDDQDSFAGTYSDGGKNTSACQFIDGGANPHAHTLDCMGDDITFDVGQVSSAGNTVIVATRSLGARIFAPFDGTQVTITGTMSSTTTLNADQFLALPPFQHVTIVSTRQIEVQTAGGDQLDDWGKYLVQIPGTGNAPAAPVIEGPAFTNVATITLTGTAPPGSQVTIFDENFVPLSGSPVTASASGTWSITTTLTDGPGAYEFTAQDALNGVPSAPTPPFTVTYDVTPPAPPSITIPQNGQTINDRTPTIFGTGEPFSTITLTLTQGGVTHTYAVTLDGSGVINFPVPLADALADGPWTLTATATDRAGNVSGPSIVNFNVDATPPAAPVITAPGQGANVPNAFTISGTAEPGSTVNVSLNGSAVGTVTAGPTGAWSLPVSGVPNGPAQITATAKDAAGNVSQPSLPVNVIVGSNSTTGTGSNTGGTTATTGSGSNGSGGTNASNGSGGTNASGSTSATTGSGSNGSGGTNVGTSGSGGTNASTGVSNGSGGTNASTGASNGSGGTNASTGGSSGSIGTSGSGGSNATTGSGSSGGSGSSNGGSDSGSTTANPIVERDNGSIAGAGCNCSGAGAGIDGVGLIFGLMALRRRRSR